MAIKPKEEREQKKPVIDLSGPEGNAFYLLAEAESLARQLGYSQYEQLELMEEMKSGNYEHLIETFDEHFGDYVDLQR